MCQCPIKTQGTKPTLYSAEAALNRVLTCFGMSRYQGKENFKLYLLHPFYFFFIRYKSGSYPL